MGITEMPNPVDMNHNICKLALNTEADGNVNSLADIWS